MTGFGESRSEVAEGVARVAVAAVNHKTVSVQLRGDLRDLSLEEQVRERVRTALVRGSANVQIIWEPTVVGGLDRERIATAWRELASLAREIGAPNPSLAEALAVAGRKNDAAGAATLPVLAALDEALIRLEQMRRREGAAMSEALRGLAVRMRKLHARMTSAAAARMPVARDRLLAIVSDAVGQAVPPETLAREVAIEAQRIDISEELVRFAAHLDALDRLIARQDPVGRELDFLAQELGREANTAGSKANDPALSELAIALKLAVDQLKEQAANCL